MDSVRQVKEPIMLTVAFYVFALLAEAPCSGRLYPISDRKGIVMNDLIYSQTEIKNLLQPVFARYPVKRATLFGSYAKGSAKKNSDVDIMVDSGLKGLAFFGLLEDVVTTLNKPIDLIDITQIEKGSDVEREIKRSGVLIYGE